MTEDAAAKLPPGIRKIAAAAVLGAFLSQLDATVVNVFLPTLAVEQCRSTQESSSGRLLQMVATVEEQHKPLITHWIVENELRSFEPYF